MTGLVATGGLTGSDLRLSGSGNEVATGSDSSTGETLSEIVLTGSEQDEIDLATGSTMSGNQLTGEQLSGSTETGSVISGSDGVTGQASTDLGDDEEIEDDVASVLPVCTGSLMIDQSGRTGWQLTGVVIAGETTGAIGNLAFTGEVMSSLLSVLETYGLDSEGVQMTDS